MGSQVLEFQGQQHCHHHHMQKEAFPLCHNLAGAGSWQQDELSELCVSPGPQGRRQTLSRATLAGIGVPRGSSGSRGAEGMVVGQLKRWPSVLVHSWGGACRLQRTLLFAQLPQGTSDCFPGETAVVLLSPSSCSPVALCGSSLQWEHESPGGSGRSLGLGSALQAGAGC